MSLRMCLNRLGAHVSFRWDGWRPRLVVRERYEKPTKWGLRVLTLTSIVTSVWAFQQWYLRLILAVCLVVTEHLLEKCILTFETLYIQPGFDFVFDEDEWTAMCFAPRRIDGAAVVGIVFQTEEYAKGFFRLLRAWNCGQDEDTENNVVLSFVMEDDGRYTVYVYPNADRQPFQAWQKQVQKRAQLQKPGKVHVPRFLSRIFRKTFRGGAAPTFRAFIRNCRPGDPFRLGAYVWSGNQEAELVEGADTILKYHFRLRKRFQLTDQDIEREWPP